MSTVGRVLFVVVGIINVLPAMGVLGAAQLESLYGREIPDPDLLLLLQHRAVLFGLLGGMLIAAAARPALRGIATLAGTVSMASFCLLALPLAAHGPGLQRVFWMDVAALALLGLAWWLTRTRGQA